MNTGPILFYDGVCGFCNGAVRFVLRHDRRGQIRFAELQGPFAAAVLRRHGRDPSHLDTMYLLLDPGSENERLVGKTDCAVAVLRELGGPWAWLALLARLPRGLRDRAYDGFVRNRYR